MTDSAEITAFGFPVGWCQFYQQGMPGPEPTFAEQMVTKLQQTLLESAGLASVTIAGQVVSYGDLQKQLDCWERRVAKEQGKRSQLIEVDFQGVV